MLYALQIGWRYLRAKKRKTAKVITVIATVGVALGVGALLSVLAITRGFENEFRRKVLGVNAHVLIMKYGDDFEEYRDVVRRAEEHQGVAGAAPFIIREMILAHETHSAGVLVKGVDPERFQSVLDVHRQLTSGTFDGLRLPGTLPAVRSGQEPGQVSELDLYLQRASALYEGRTWVPPGEATPAESRSEVPESEPSADEDVGPIRVPSPADAEVALRERDPFAGQVEVSLPSAPQVDTAVLPGLVVGATLAENLGLEVGSRVTVTSPVSGFARSLLGDDSVTPPSIEFRVIGVFHAGFQEYDTRLVYADLYQVQRLFGRGDSVMGVELTLHDIDRARETARYFERTMGAGPYHTLDWFELNRNLFAALELQKVMLSLIIATIVFIAAFNVVATLMITVLDRKKEIAILKAMGAAPLDILVIFLLQGLVIGLVGIALGIALGGGVCYYLETHRMALDPRVYLIDHLPVLVDRGAFVSTALISLVICGLATALPSVWAARMRPAEGIRQD